MNNFERFQTFVVQQAAKEGPISPPITGSAAFGYGDPESAQQIFEGRLKKPLYARMGNPTLGYFERLVAGIDQGDGAVGFASGMGAISALMSAFLQNGDEVVCVGGLFGGSFALFNETLPRFGIKARFFSSADEVEVSDKTRMIYCESVGNPTTKIVNFAKLSKLAKEYGLLFVVDNTISPLLFEPFGWGADIVVYSTTKIIAGHSQALGGAVVYKELRKELSERFPFLKTFHENLGKDAVMGVLKKRALRDFGMSMSAYHAYLSVLGLETLALRIPRVTQSAQQVAEAMRDVAEVYYESDDRYFPHGIGPMMAIDLETKERAFAFLKRSKMLYITANIGDARTLGLHMESTIYKDFSPEHKRFLGITPGLVRLSIGLENPDLLIEDFLAATK